MKGINAHLPDEDQCLPLEMAGPTIWRVWQVSGAGAESWQIGNIFTHTNLKLIFTANRILLEFCLHTPVTLTWWTIAVRAELPRANQSRGRCEVRGQPWLSMLVIHIHHTVYAATIELKTLFKSSHTCTHTHTSFQFLWPLFSASVTFPECSNNLLAWGSTTCRAQCHPHQKLLAQHWNHRKTLPLLSGSRLGGDLHLLPERCHVVVVSIAQPADLL